MSRSVPPTSRKRPLPPDGGRGGRFLGTQSTGAPRRKEGGDGPPRPAPPAPNNMGNNPCLPASVGKNRSRRIRSNQSCPLHAGWRERCRLLPSLRCRSHVSWRSHVPDRSSSCSLLPLAEGAKWIDGFQNPPHFFRRIGDVKALPGDANDRKKDDSDPRIGRSRRWGFGRGKQKFGVHRMPSRSAVGWMASEGIPAYCIQYFSPMVKENALNRRTLAPSAKIARVRSLHGDRKWSSR